MSRLYDTEEALNLILDDAEADSDGELAEPICPGSDEEFDIDIDQELFSFNPMYEKYNYWYVYRPEYNAKNNSNEASNPEDGDHEADSNISESSSCAAALPPKI